MIIPVLIIAGVVLSVLAVTVFLLILARAPEGEEDETGFHCVEKTIAVQSRYYCAESKSPRPPNTATPFKKHIPAA